MRQRNAQLLILERVAVERHISKTHTHTHTHTHTCASCICLKHVLRGTRDRERDRERRRGDIRHCTTLCSKETSTSSIYTT